MTISGGLIMNHSFTLRTWAKVLNTNGRLFSINRNDYAFIGAEEYLQWGYNTDRATFKFAIGTEVILEHTTRTKAFEPGQWQFLALTVQFDNNEPQHSLVEFRGLSTLIDSETFESIFTDHVAYNKYFGAEDEVTSPGNVQKAKFFNGYMYEFCIDNFYDTDFANEARPGNCGTNMCT